MKKFFLVLLLGIALISIGKATQAGELDRFKGMSGTIDIAGGTAHIPVLKDAAKRVMSFNPKIKITIAGGGSGVGIQKVGEGLVDIGNSGRKPEDTEIKKYGLKLYPWALDGVAVVLNKKNKVSSFRSSQVQDIYSGKLSNWRDVDGNDATINLYTRDEASGTRAVFWKKMLKKGKVSSKANVVPSNGAMKVAVANDPNAIGYISIGHIDETVKAPIVDGVKPSQETALSGEYKVVRKLYSNAKGEPKPLVKAFIDYIMGPEGEKIIKKHNFIPIQ
ncbi:MAG TPA: phosphate ABC transporter substrate-binding protein [Nitrospinota bacterium]|nr:phosphate ABC transporter substrate-binding protein [Nitrospinota bacterium]